MSRRVLASKRTNMNEYGSAVAYSYMAMMVLAS